MDKRLSKYELSNVLLKWFQTLHSKGAHNTLTDICDGVAMAHALHQIAPEYFGDIWLSKIKVDVGQNWRLKVSNLRKIIEGLVDYYQDYFNRPLTDFGKPDAARIGEHSDPEEISKLLQLILGCAVNCNKKQEYIENIMLLEESVQSVIMQSIQELEHTLGSSSLSFSAMNLHSESETHIQQLVNELQLMKESHDRLSNKCLELEMQVGLLKEEKSSALEENRKIHYQLREMMSTQVDHMKDNVTRKQIESLKEELFKLETSRDDYRLKVELQNKELTELQSKFDTLQQTAAEARQLKDEVDILRENADKVEKLESVVNSYKKKLEDMSELKREMKLLESKNLNYIQQVMELEEELKKASSWKSQVEVYKKQVSDLRNALAEETKKVDKMEFENMKIQEKLNVSQQEKERIAAERDTLKEANEELMCSKLQFSKGHEMSPDNQKVGMTNEAIIMSKAEMKREITRLQHENSLLKLNQKDERLLVLQLTVDDLSQQNKQLQLEYRRANQHILSLEAELKELQGKGKVEVDVTDAQKDLRHQLQLEKSHRLSENVEKDRIIQEQKQLISMLQETAVEKEQEIQYLEEKYKKYLEKARFVAKSLEIPHMTSSNLDARNKTNDKTALPDGIENCCTHPQIGKEVENKATFQSVTTQKKQREYNEHKQLPAIHSVGSNLTFLGKQRQSAMKRISFNSK